MRIVFIADSLEVNGGCIMFLEMLAAFKKYTTYSVEGYVVSKTGKYGRENLVHSDLPLSYVGYSVTSLKYEEINQLSLSDSIVIHHRNSCTKPLYNIDNYFVINHVVDNIDRISQFRHAKSIISVCNYIKKISSSFADSKVILNGIENDFVDKLPAAHLDGEFITGRCHRLVPTKFSEKSVDFLNDIRIKGHRHYIIGPITAIRPKNNNTCCHLGPIFDKEKKMSIIKTFDVYFYDTFIKEGASVAILESLACGVPVLCKPLGGNAELIRHGINGYFYNNYDEAANYLQQLSNNKQELLKLKRSTIEDFNTRLHIKNVVPKYLKEINCVKS